MKTTGLFTIRNYRIDVEKLGDPIYLIPFGDVHKFAPLHASDRWQEFIDWAKTKKRAYFIGMGDYQDLASASERNAIKTGKFHESTIMTLEQLYEKFIDEFYKDIEFMRGRVVGLIEGNHYSEFTDGTTSTQRICQKLKCNYLGVSAFVRLSFWYKNHVNAVDIWAHHGKGAARLLGGSLNRVTQMAEQADADIFLMSHDHRKSVGTTSKLRLQGA